MYAIVQFSVLESSSCSPERCISLSFLQTPFSHYYIICTAKIRKLFDSDKKMRLYLGFINNSMTGFTTFEE